MNSVEIKSPDGTLLAIHLQNIEDIKGKLFITEGNAQLQIGLFGLSDKESIQRHWHPPQDRVLTNTVEVLIVLSGVIESYIYNQDLTLNSTIFLESGSILLLLEGGHGFNVIGGAKFVEVKQGPYIGILDKTLF